MKLQLTRLMGGWDLSSRLRSANPRGMVSSARSRIFERCEQLVGLSSALMFSVLLSLAQSDPNTELASFRVLPGFEVNLFASEREGVVKPIQLRFDPDGRLWVVGSVVYPQVKPGENPNDQVIYLEDTDRDGRADRATVFANGLHIPTGIELGDGGVYVGAGTELWHLRDTDGDGQADERRVVLRGFGTGDTHQTINSFTWGPSGELMMSQGLHAESRVETPWGIAELKQAGVWRFWPRAVRLDAFWSGAMGPHNPFGTVFDRWGQPLVFAGNGHGIYHLTEAMIRTDHFLEQPSIWNQGRKFGGADFVENSHWPAELQGEVVSGGYLQNTVERFRLTDAGATFHAERLPPLIESTNTAFRIVDARFGPDGALYLCDWYNPIIGHYQASFRDPARDKAHGRIWRVTARGRPLVAWQPLSRKPIPELVERLGSTERWERQMAHRVLAERNPAETAQAIRRWLEVMPTNSSAGDLARCEALGVLANLGVVETNLLVQLAHAAEPNARAFAARVVGQWADRLDANAFELPLRLLTQLVADPNPRVRLEAVVACSYVPTASAVEVAARVADAPMEPALAYAWTQCVHALRPWWQAAQTRGELRFEGRSARISAFLEAEGGTRSATDAAGRLRRISEVALDPATIRQLSAVVASAGSPADLTALLNPRSFTTGTNYDSGLHAARLSEAAESGRRRNVRPAGDLAPSLSQLLASANPEVRAAALRAVGAWHVESLRPRLESTVADPARTDLERVAGVHGIGLWGDAAARRSLEVWARDERSPAVRSAAISEQVFLEPKSAADLAALWFQAPVDVTWVAEIGRAFLRQRDALAALTKALQTKAPAPSVATALREQLARSGRQDPDLNAVLLAAAGKSARAQPWSEQDVVAVAQAARTRGNPGRGRELFQSTPLACTTCHSVDGTPGKIGPDLSALGTAQTVEFVAGAIIEPQKEVKEGFMAYELIAKDGTTYQGYLRGETPDSVALLDHLSGQTVRITRGEIAEQRQLGSLMPAGLVDGLSADELRDLVAYLAGLGRK